jgi:catechol 2,3-dioxygenase-like lactoylglutathione lyase family enzyme
MAFRGFDHIDLRVPALGVVEAFYDAFLPRLGLTRKTYAWVEFGGSSWNDTSPEHYNTVEYHEDGADGRPPHFIGIIEESSAQPARGRIAFAVDGDTLDEWERFLPTIGAREIERGDPEYPAVFFTDPLGTRLEVCSRRVRS